MSINIHKNVTQMAKRGTLTKIDVFIGAEYLTKIIKWNDSLYLRLQLWDIAGQETFKFLSKSFYENAVGAFVVTDLTRWETLGTAFCFNTLKGESTYYIAPWVSKPPVRLLIGPM